MAIDVADDSDGLNTRERMFVEHFVCGSHKTIGRPYHAAVAAGYSRSYAQTYACTWIHDRPNNEKMHVYRAIEIRREEIKARTKMSSEEAVLEISKIARFNMASAVKHDEDGRTYTDLTDLEYDEFAAVSEITIDEYKEGRGEDAVDVKKIRVKMHDKLKALDILTRIYGMQRMLQGNDPDNPLPGTTVNVGVRYDLTKLTLEEATQLRDLLAKASVVID